ncbi:MAG: YgiT-type zinc finger protein [Desulfobacteraceae bacterium]|nr:YgiT-type zinc finger protein [Desulfobacteraceae bacterium]
MEFYDGMICPVCEAGLLKSVRKDLDFEYKGVKTIIPEQKVFECSECGELFQNKNDQQHINHILKGSKQETDDIFCEYACNTAK